MSYSDKYNTMSTTKDTKQFSFDTTSYQESKYSTLNTKTCYDTSDSIFTSTDIKYSTLGSKYQDKTGYLGSTYTTEAKYSPIGNNKDKNLTTTSYDTSPNISQSSMLLGVEETPTPTSSIETEDSTTREVGERDVEGDGEQSD